ncbi:MAG: hypothetical protein OEU92_16325 [Alphaproteobacteria bacterium]|nr:hypothetical protein [Alphaproteobacteria bacterium]
MATSSTLKALKREDGSIVNPRSTPASARSNRLVDRLHTLWHSIWRRRWLSVATAWLICLAGWAVVTLWPTNFIASAVIYADLAELAGPKADAKLPGQKPVAMLRSMLLSDDGLEAVRSRVALDPEEDRSLEADILLRSTVPPVFVLAYEHENPDVAQQVLETVIFEFQSGLDDAKAESIEAAAALDEQIGERQRRLQTTEADVVTFKRTNADYLEAGGAKTAELALLEEEVDSLEQQIETTTADRDGIALELAKAREPEAAAAEAQALKSPEQLETERKALNGELAKLQERYADTHPYVIAVQDAIKALNAEALTSSSVADVDDGPVDREALEQRHGELIVEVSSLKSRLGDKRREIELLQALTRTTTSVEAELAQLEAGKEQLQTALADLRQRRDELGETSGGDAKQEAFRLIKQPELPTDPVGPSRLMALAAVLLGGAGMGALAAVVCNRVKGVFESAWQLSQRFDVGVLGTIPEVMTPAERKQLDYSRLTFGLACLALIGAFSGLAIAELTDRLAPLGETLRVQFLG